MRKRIKKTSLVFARRKTTVSRGKRGKHFLSLKKVLFILLIAFLSVGSMYTGHLFAKNSTFPVFENKVPKAVIQPVVLARGREPLEKLLEEKEILFEEISYATTSSTAVITLQKNSFAYIDSSGNLANQIEQLSKILTRMKIENPGKLIKYIDLRYGRPIVKF